MQPLGLCNSGKQIFLFHAVIKVKVWWIHFSPPEELQTVLFDCLLAVIHCDLWSEPSNSSFFLLSKQMPETSLARILRAPNNKHCTADVSVRAWLPLFPFKFRYSPRYSLKMVHHVSIHAWQTRYFIRIECNNFQGTHTSVVSFVY